MIDHDGSWAIMMDHDGSWSVMIHHDRSWSIMIDHDESWSIMANDDPSWWIMINHGHHWSVLIHNDRLLRKYVKIWLDTSIYTEFHAKVDSDGQNQANINQQSRNDVEIKKFRFNHMNETLCKDKSLCLCESWCYMLLANVRSVLVLACFHGDLENRSPSMKK